MTLLDFAATLSAGLIAMFAALACFADVVKAQEEKCKTQRVRITRI